MRKVFSLLFIASFLLMSLLVKAQPKLEECNNGLYNGWVTSLLMKDDIMFIGTTKNGLYKSFVQGLDCISLNKKLPITRINCLAHNGKIIFAGTDSGLFSSDDNGVTWNNINSESWINNNINCILVDSLSNLFVGMNNGIYHSSDYGLNWQEVNYGLDNKLIKCLVKFEDKLIAGSEGSGIFISTDNGSRWSASINGLSNHDIRCFAVCGNSIFTGSWGGGIFISTDEGVNWQEVNKGLTNLKINTLTVIGTNIYAGTEDGVFLSMNNGLSWITYNSGLGGLSILSITESQNRLYASTKFDGIYCLNYNEDNWYQLDNEFPLIRFNCLACNSKNIYCSNTGLGVYVSSTFENIWKTANTGLSNNNITSLAVSGDSIFAATWGTLEFLTENNNTWKTIYKCPSYSQVRKIFILGNDLYFCLEMDVLNAKRNELIWKQIMYNEVISMAKIGQKSFAGMEKQFTPKHNIYGGGVFIKNEDDTLWKESGFENNSVGNMVVNKSNLLIQSDNGFFITTDLGASWKPVTYNSPGPHIALLVGNGKDLFLGTTGMNETPGMLLSSSDNGANWKVIDTIYSKKYLTNMNICGNYLYLNFTRDGIYRMDISDYVTVEEKPSAEEFSVYPNPAGDFITVTLNPSEGSAINIYNTLGEMVLSVGKGRDLSERINISDLPKGVYFVKAGELTAKFVKI